MTAYGRQDSHVSGSVQHQRSAEGRCGRARGGRGQPGGFLFHKVSTAVSLMADLAGAGSLRGPRCSRRPPPPCGRVRRSTLRAVLRAALGAVPRFHRARCGIMHGEAVGAGDRPGCAWQTCVPLPKHAAAFVLGVPMGWSRCKDTGALSRDTSIDAMLHRHGGE